MKINPINNTNFKQVVETHRKEDYESKNNESKDNKSTYETTIIYKEIVKVPKNDEEIEETLQQINYMI